MVIHKPQLVVFSPDSALLEKLKPFSRMLPYMSYEVGFGPEVTAKAHLDAFWVTPMGAVELFGAAPPFPLYEAVVLKTPAMQLNKGFPRYGVAGVAVPESDAKSPEHGLRLTISAMLKAIQDFNTKNRDQIVRIGILPDDLGLRAIQPEAAFSIISESYGAASRDS